MSKAGKGRAGREWLTGGGEMGKLIRAKDWSRTPLGPIESWPQSLLTVVGMMLNSQYPMFLAWGEKLSFLYNDGYRPILGEKHPAALGQPFATIWSEIWSDIAPLVERALAGKATWSENLQLFMERSGFKEEVYFTFSYSPVRNETGRVGGMFCACTETTQNVLGERQMTLLRELAAACGNTRDRNEACERSLRVLRSNPHDFLFVAIYLANPNESGLSLAGVSGITRGHGWAPEEVVFGEGTILPLEAAFRGGDILIADAPFIADSPLPTGAWEKPPSHIALARLTATGQTNRGGLLVTGLNPFRQFNDHYRNFLMLVVSEIAASISAAQAFAEEKKRAEALVELDRAKTSFFSNVSHEFRTPLTLMLGPLEDALANVDGGLPPETAMDLTIVYRNSLRLLKLVNTLLDFSRIEAGRIHASYEPTDLAAFTADLASVFRSAVERAGLRLIVTCPPLKEPVFVDREMWEKIVLNLLSNAFKFTFEGEIEVSLLAISSEKEGPCITLTIRDTGIGIPAHEVPCIFDRFHRVKDSRGRSHEGSGIGLALVQELVKLHGGIVRVESEIGRGSRFMVFVPLGSDHLPADRLGAARTFTSTAVHGEAYAEEALRWLPTESSKNGIGEKTAEQAFTQSASEPVSRNLPSKSQEGGRILWADDNADMREYVRRLLHQAGFDVEAVANGQEALAVARITPPDLVLTDIMMPNLDGLNLLHELRINQATAEIPVILLSARAGEEARIEGMMAGADDYLVKPFSARELLARVDAHMKMARERRKANAAIRMRGEQLETLMNQVPLGLYLVDADFHIVQVNPVARAVFGDIPGGVIGRDFNEIIHRLWDKKYTDEIVSIFRHTLNTGDPYVRSECAGFRIDRGVTEYYEWRLDRIMLPDGRYGLVCYFRDISQQVQAREALRESEERFRTLADNMSQLAWMADENGWIFWYNQRWFDYTGTTLQEMQGWGWKQVHHPDHVDRVVERIQKSWDTGEPWEDTFPLRGKGGQYHWFLSRALPIRDAAGNIVRWFGTNTDITDLRDAQDALRQSETRLQAFAIQLEQLVEERTAELFQSQERLRALARELNLAEQRERKRLAAELHDHLQQLLVLGKLKLGQGMRTGQKSPAYTELMQQMDDLLSDALTYTRTLIADLSPPVLRDHGLPEGLMWLAEEMKKRELAVAVSLPEHLDLRLPEDQLILLFQSVRELLINASKYAGTGEARVQLVQRENYLHIEVRDTGAGFNPAAVDMSHELSSKFGLFSIGERMQSLGGSFDIQSAPGKGTKATLSLPMPGVLVKQDWAEDSNAQKEAASPQMILTAASPPDRPRWERPQSILVLLVDDHAMVRQGLRTVLEGYEDMKVIGEAANGLEAIKAVNQLHPHVVVMDINMPTMDGIEATARIKADHPDLVIVGLSMHIGDAHQKAMNQAGAFMLIPKEAAVERLYSSIHEAVRSSLL